MQTDKTKKIYSAQLVIFTLTRTIINSGYRLVIPFLPVIARGFDISLEAAASAIALRSLVGIAGPLWGSISDLHGRKKGMLIGLAFFILGMLVVTLFPDFTPFVIAMLLVALAKGIFDSALLAYLGDNVAYAQRGRAFAIVEIGWSMSALIGIPIAGFLIDRGDWRSHWPWFAAAGFLMTVIIYLTTPATKPSKTSQPDVKAIFSALSSNRIAVSALVFTLLICIGNQFIFVIFGAWLEDAFALNVVAIGGATAVIGLAELSGEGLVAAVTDKLGKKRAILLGLGINTLTSLLLPWIGSTLTGGLLGLFLFYISFEFALVSILPMVSEIMPHARGTMIAGTIAALEIGHAVGAFIAPRLYHVSFLASGLGTAVLNLAGIFVLFFFVNIQSESKLPAESQAVGEKIS